MAGSGGSFDFVFTGDVAYYAKIDAVMDSIEREIAARLFQRAETVMARSKSVEVPVQYGHLRDSGHVALPIVTRGRVVVKLGYGGPSAPYAVYVHENMFAHHTVGGPKYLERPMLAEARTLDAQIADAIKRGISAA